MEATKSHFHSGYCRGFFTRFIFLIHGSLSLYILYVNKNFENVHFLLALPLALLFAESVTTLCLRNGKEAGCVWPCGFIYISTIVPIIWMLDLGAMEQRQPAHLNSTMVVELARFIGSNDTSTVRKLLLPDALKIADVSSRRFCQIGVLFGLILGRWITPRGRLSRAQLSAMLLGYVATAADILEFLESHDESDTLVVEEKVCMDG